MKMRLLALTLCLTVVFLGSPLVFAQTPAGPGAMGQGGMMQMTGTMQQMGGMMKQMSEMMTAGQMSPDRMKAIGGWDAANKKID